MRVRDTRRDQIATAKQYGIDGFCYHYYWFSGKRLLNLPLDDMLSDVKSDMPFCLCWANENWTRRWDASENEILIAQKYLPDDDLNFIKSLIPFFEDSRYIRVDGKPILIVYRAKHLPDPKNTLRVWRDYCKSIGLGEIHISAALTHGFEGYKEYGFDSGLEFPPHNLRSSNINEKINFFDGFKGNVIDFSVVAESYINRNYENTNIFKTVVPSWDNSARTKDRALILLNGEPDNYEFWLASTIDITNKANKSDQLVFINAWNEWAEGCHLEPDRLFGHGFLQATLNAKQGLRRFLDFPNRYLVYAKSEDKRRKFLKDLMAVVSYHWCKQLCRLKGFVNGHSVLYKFLYPPLAVLKKIRDKFSK